MTRIFGRCCTRTRTWKVDVTKQRTEDAHFRAKDNNKERYLFCRALCCLPTASPLAHHGDRHRVAEHLHVAENRLADLLRDHLQTLRPGPLEYSVDCVRRSRAIRMPAELDHLPALQPIRAPDCSAKWHVLLEVIFHVEFEVGGAGVEDCGVRGRSSGRHRSRKLANTCICCWPSCVVCLEVVLCRSADL